MKSSLESFRSSFRCNEIHLGIYYCRIIWNKLSVSTFWTKLPKQHFANFYALTWQDIFLLFFSKVLIMIQINVKNQENFFKFFYTISHVSYWIHFLIPRERSITHEGIWKDTLPIIWNKNNKMDPNKLLCTKINPIKVN